MHQQRFDRSAGPWVIARTGAGKFKAESCVKSPRQYIICRDFKKYLAALSGLGRIIKSLQHMPPQTALLLRRQYGESQNLAIAADLLTQGEADRLGRVDQQQAPDVDASQTVGKHRFGPGVRAESGGMDGGQRRHIGGDKRAQLGHWVASSVGGVGPQLTSGGRR